MKTTTILGISAYYHDSAAAILIDGKITAAAQEERFTRLKHDATFPSNAIKYCLIENDISLLDLDYIVFYDKPLLKFERILETYISYAPKGFKSFLRSIPIWIKEKLFLKKILRRELADIEGIKEKQLPPLLFTSHHQSHAASAFFPSPYKKSAVLCLDGVGEWATSSVWIGSENTLTPVWQIDFPHSLGLLYSAFTYYCGFKVNSGEYKLMGLAPYGEPKYVDTILNNLIDIKHDGTFRLNMEYFNYTTGLTMTNRRFDTLFDGKPRKPETKISQREMDIASSIQVVVEKIVLRLAITIHKEHNVDNLCLAGGVALNCVSNGNLLRNGPFKNIWIQPASGDAGGAVGAALSIWNEYLGNTRIPDNTDSLGVVYLGPQYTTSEVCEYLEQVNATYKIYEYRELLLHVAKLLSDGNVIGWFQGRMEFGPRALGNRSILGDPRNENMQVTMNQKIKHRESFRPFAPAVKADKVSEWFCNGYLSPYMLLVDYVNDSKKKLLVDNDSDAQQGFEKLKTARSLIPAVTHVDYSARVQTVRKEDNSLFYSLLDHFEKYSGCPILINTSFNVRGEPIVCTPEDAFKCFMRTDMDYLVIQDVLISKKDQKNIHPQEKWNTTIVLD